MSRKGTLYNAVQRRAIDQVLKLATSDNKKSILAAAAIAEKMTPEHRKRELNWVVDQIRNETPVLQIVRHVVRDLSPACREKVIQNLILTALLQTSSKREAFTERTGAHTPLVILISPTMRCNLTCEGCYAAEYAPDADMSPETLQSIVDQANDIGIYLFTILGGEPFVKDDLLDFCEENSDSYFQVYTNGTLIDEDAVERLARDRQRRSHAQHRGRQGGHRRPPRRRRLRPAHGDHGQPQGGRRRLRYLVDRHPPQLQVPRQRRVRRPAGRQGRHHRLELPLHAARPRARPEPHAHARGAQRVPRGRPAHPGREAAVRLDFWGDAPLVGGCIAAKWYMHINSEGWVEPCIFTHFATHNINESTLEEAITSPYFNEIRRRQPYNHNLLMPCMWIDNPQQSREIMAATGAKPTHDGADVMLQGPAEPARRVRRRRRPGLHAGLVVHGRRPAHQVYGGAGGEGAQGLRLTPAPAATASDPNEGRRRSPPDRSPRRGASAPLRRSRPADHATRAPRPLRGRRRAAAHRTSTLRQREVRRQAHLALLRAAVTTAGRGRPARRGAASVSRGRRSASPAGRRER